MIKNMRLGVKMTLGFGLVIAMVAGVGGLAILNMLAIQREAGSLKDKYVPEVAVANELERNSLQTMYSMHGYIYSFKEELWTEGRSYLNAVDKHMRDAEALSRRYGELTKLKEGVGTAQEQVAAYEKLAAATEATIRDIQRQRELLDAKTAEYQRDCSGYLDNQNRSMASEITAWVSTGRLHERLRKIKLITSVIDLGSTAQVANWKTQTYHDHSLVEEGMKNFTTIDEKLAEMRPITRQRVDLELLDRIGADGQECRKAMAAIMADYERLEELNRVRNESAGKLLAVAQALAGQGIEQTQQIANASVARVAASVVTSMVGLLVALLLAVVIAVSLTRMIVSPVRQGVAFAGALAGGDLSAEIAVSRTDEIGTLASSLNRMAANLRAMVRRINDTAAQVASSSAELTAGAQRLSEGAQSQASTLEETSAGVEELTASVEQVAEHAQSQAASVEEAAGNMGQMQASVEQVSRTLSEVSRSSQESMGSAQAGMAAVGQAVEAMRAIAASSERMAGIIGVIGEIASQTNLLALNAAIEAARAGEHGRGFAVVADEVGKLAERSSSSAKEIGALIKESGKSVAAGVQIAGAALAGMEAIIGGAKKTHAVVEALSHDMGRQTGAIGELGKATDSIAEMSQSIRAATEEQTTNARQVAKAIENVNELTQQAAGAAEEMSGATQELSGLARSLQRLVEQFRLAEDGRKEERSGPEAALQGNPVGRLAGGEETESRVERSVTRV